MRELSLHVLDIAQNSISAKATLIRIGVSHDDSADRLVITISDNGSGMTEQQLEMVRDPFYTTRTTRKVGLGIPLFRMAAEMAGGNFSISSKPGKGTDLRAEFILSHIDRIPLGDMTDTIVMLIRYNSSIDFVYCYEYNGRDFTLDTRELRGVLQDVPLDTPDVAAWIKEYIEENIRFITA